jgi:hypothetical protein
MQISAIPTGPTYYQPVTAVPPVPPVVSRPSDGDEAGARLRATQPAGIGSLLDIEA